MTQTVCLRIVYAEMPICESCYASICTQEVGNLKYHFGTSSWVLIEVSCLSPLILPMIDTFDGSHTESSRNSLCPLQ